MNKISLLLVFIFFQLASWSQDLSLLELKRPIEEKDHPALLRYTQRLYLPLANFQYEFSNFCLTKEIGQFYDKVLTEKDFLEAKEKIKTDSSNAYYYLDAGNALKAINRFTEAQKYYARALDITVKEIKEKPKDAGLYQRAGIIYSAQGNMLMTILSYEKAMEIDPQRDTIASVMLPLAYMNAGFFIKLKDHSTKLLEKYPDSTIMHLFYFFGPLFERMSNGFDFGPKSAEQFFTEWDIYKDFDSTRLNQALKRDPENIELLQLMHGAEIYGLLFESVNAIDYDSYKFNLCQKSKENIEKHKMFFQSVIKKKKSNNLYFAYYSLGTLEAMLNNYKPALSYFEKALKYFPSDKYSFQFNPSACMESIIFSNILMGDTALAEKNLDKKMKARPLLYENAADYFAKAKYRMYANDFEKAKFYAAKTLELDSSYHKINLFQTYFLLENKEYKKAQKVLDELYSEYNDDFDYNFTYAILLLMQNDASTAKIFLTKALTLGPEDKTINRIIDTYFKMP